MNSVEDKMRAVGRRLRSAANSTIWAVTREVNFDQLASLPFFVNVWL